MWVMMRSGEAGVCDCHQALFFSVLLLFFFFTHRTGHAWTSCSTLQPDGESTVSVKAATHLVHKSNLPSSSRQTGKKFVNRFHLK